MKPNPAIERRIDQLLALAPAITPLQMEQAIRLLVCRPDPRSPRGTPRRPPARAE